VKSDEVLGDLSKGAKCTVMRPGNPIESFLLKIIRLPSDDHWHLSEIRAVWSHGIDRALESSDSES
jgi:hypothetical protein